nr:ralBP1-associated Eps domain-containing protein 1-like [Aegilops tauschii subsp. strangulata]
MEGVAPVLVSPDDFGEEGRPDSEATLEGEGETSPLAADLLHSLPDDNEAGDHPVRESQTPAGVTTRSRGTPPKKPSTGVPTKSRSALVSRGGATALTSTGAAAGPATAASSTPGTRKSAPQDERPPGSALLKRPWDYAAMDQPTLVEKKKREGAATPSETQQPGMATPPPAQKGGNSPRASPARSSSRGPEDRPQEKSTSTAQPASEAPVLSSPAESLSALTQLQDDLQGADHRLVVGRLELISGWLHSDASVGAALGQAMAASEKDKRAVDQAAATREVALKDAEATKERCRAVEVELENLRKEQAVVARQLDVREEKVKAQEEADPNADLAVLLEPVDEERCAAAAKAVKGQVEALVKKFLAIDPAPPADGAADPVTKANDTTEGDAADRKALPDDGAQG